MSQAAQHNPWLITGASGFLGAHVLREAAAASARRIAMVCRSRLPPDGSGDELRSGVEVAAFDLAQESQSLEDWLDRFAPRVVIHTAALARIADAEGEPALARRINVDAVERLAVWCARREARFVLVSTDLVFGGRAAPPEGFAESDEPAPLSVYGATKLEGERRARVAAPSSCVVRLPLLCGPSHGRGLGASDALLAAVARGERATLFEDEWRSPLDVRAAARALVEIAGTNVSGLLHFGGPERLSRLDLGLRVLRQAGLRADQVRAALVAGRREAAPLSHTRPRDVSLDSRRARGLLRTLPVGLADGGRAVGP